MSKKNFKVSKKSQTFYWDCPKKDGQNVRNKMFLRLKLKKSVGAIITLTFQKLIIVALKSMSFNPSKSRTTNN
jgi:hypothetical protein